MNSNPGQRTVRTVTARNIWASSVGIQYIPAQVDGTNSYDGANNSYETELREGWLMAQVTATKKWVPCKRSATNGAGVASQTLIVDNAAAFKTGDTVKIGGNQAVDVLKLDDADNAASVGVAVYLHIDEKAEGGYVGHLEFVSPTNADGYIQLASGDKILVDDDDAAATGGLQIYADEDATNKDGRLLAAVTGGVDAFVRTAAGRMVRIAYNAAPGTPGVAIYFDEDATAVDRVKFVSPTNADSVQHTDDSALTNVDKLTRSSGNAITAINYSTNTITLTTAATWIDGDAVTCDSLAGSEICRGILDEFVQIKDPDNNTAYDRPVGRLAIGGTVKSSKILGDLDAVLASSDTQLSGFKFDTLQGAA